MSAEHATVARSQLPERDSPSSKSPAPGLVPAEASIEAPTEAPTGRARRHVLFLINSLAGGGAERVMCTLLRASEAERSDHRLTLVLLDRDPPAYQVPSWVTVMQLDCRGSLLRSVWQVWRVLRRMRPDVTLSFLTRANIANVMASALARVPAIVSERVNTTSHLGAGLSGKLARLLVRATYPRARAIIAVSPGVAEDLRSSFAVRDSRLAVIPNPIDGAQIRARADAGTPVAMDGPYIVAMGRLVPNKNFAMLIDAYARANIGPKLLILGEGPERDALTLKIAAHSLSNRVVLSGFIDNPFPTLRRAVAYVSPSNAEGFPNSLLEAMSLGLPVISTNCLSGPSEVLADMARDEVSTNVCFALHGILVPIDDAAAMADALRALDDPGHRRIYGEKARRRAADYGVARAKDAYWSVIRAHLPVN